MTRQSLAWDGICRMILCALFLVIAPWQIHVLRHAKVKTTPNWRMLAKSLCYIELLFNSTVLYAFDVHNVPIEPPALALALLVSWLAASRTTRPIWIISTLLAGLLWLDIVLLLRGPGDIFYLLLGRVGVDVALLLLENESKIGVLLIDYQHLPPYSLAGPLSRLLFWWVNPVLLRFSKKPLDDPPPLDESLASATVRRHVLEHWKCVKISQPAGEDQPLLAKPHSVKRRTSLLRTLFVSLWKPLLAAAPCRLLLILCRYAQPALISVVIDFVTGNDPLLGKPSMIVFAAVSVYVGLSLSTAAYQHRLDRLKIMIRASLASLVHTKTLRLHAAAGDAEDGRITTVINTDTEMLVPAGEMLHETWGQLVEVIIGMIILVRQLGPVSFVLLASIFACSQVSRYVGRHLPPKQRAWNVATQQRLAYTASFLNSYKSIKMTGSIPYVRAKLLDLRDAELTAAKGLRWVMIAANASANALGILSPLLVIVLYAILADHSWFPSTSYTFDAKTVFTAIAVLTMVTHPANMVMTMVPRLLAAYASVQRIDNYLQERETDVVREQASAQANLSGSLANSSTHSSMIDLDLKGFGKLGDVKLCLEPGLTVCVGPVGCGKSTLIRAILGELDHTDGETTLGQRAIGLCTQVPWLPAGTIMAAIVGPAAQDNFDAEWYQTVLKACCLDKDLLTLSLGDQTQVGSRGSNVSGGQRQRIALARALYARPDFYVFDDPFSALDPKTESRILDNLFGSSGLLGDLAATPVFMTTSKGTSVAICFRV